MEIQDSSKLKELIIARPDLEIVPFCSEECGGADGYMMGEVSRCSIEHIAFEAPWDDEMVMIKSESEEYFHDWTWDSDDVYAQMSDADAEELIADKYKNIN